MKESTTELKCYVDKKSFIEWQDKQSSKAEENRMELFNSIPAEIWVHIFSFLKIKDVPQVARACHFFKSVTSSDFFWKYMPTGKYDYASNKASLVTDRSFFNGKTFVLDNGLIAIIRSKKVEDYKIIDLYEVDNKLTQPLKLMTTINLNFISKKINDIKSLSNTFLVIVSDRNAVYLWNIKKNKYIDKLDIANRIDEIAVSSQLEKLIAVTDYQKNVYIWNIETYEQKCFKIGLFSQSKIHIKDNKILTLQAMRRGSFISIWDVNLIEVIKKINISKECIKFSAALLPNGNLAIILPSKAYVLNFKSLTIVRKATGDWLGSFCQPIDDNTIAVIANESKQIRLLSLTSSDSPAVLDFPISLPDDTDFQLKMLSPGYVLISSSRGVEIWKFPEIKAQRKLDGSFYLPRSNCDEITDEASTSRYHP